MKLIISLLLILSIGLVSNLAYADHSEEFTVTLDKESYEFGDIVYGEGQLIAPWNSTAWAGYDLNTYMRVGYIGDHVFYPTIYPESTVDQDTGIFTFSYILDSFEMIAGTYTIDIIMTTNVPNTDKVNYHIPTNHNGVPFDVIINSDHRSIVLQHADDVSSLESFINLIDTDMFKHNENMTIHDEYMSSHDLQITSLEKMVATLEETVIFLQKQIDNILDPPIGTTLILSEDNTSDPSSSVVSGDFE